MPPELIRSITGRLRAFVGNRRWATRYRAQLPLTLSVVTGGQAGREKTGSSNQRPPSISGQTFDLSSSGVALILPVIRIGDQYLAGEDRLLDVQLNLHTGQIQLQVSPVRYDAIEDDEGKRYLIGARIKSISDRDRALYDEFLKTLS